jgi:hypothetical protein
VSSSRVFFQSLQVAFTAGFESEGQMQAKRVLRVSGETGYYVQIDPTPRLKGRHFSSDAEGIVAAETCLGGQPPDFFWSGLQKLEQRAKKCVELGGKYVE